VAREADDRELLLQVVDYYNETLKQSPEAHEVSGIARPEIFGDHRPLPAGLRQPDAGLCLPAKNRAAGAEMRGRLQKLGILRGERARALQRLAGRPGHQSSGDVVEMYGRKITPNLREGRRTICICPAARGVWNEEALIASKEIILCEALIDALDVLGCGLPQRDGQLRRERLHSRPSRGLREARHERVYIAYDRDEAGNKAAAKLAEELMQMGIECFRVQFPKGMDANEYALKVTPAAKSLGVLLNKARRGWARASGQSRARSLSSWPSRRSSHEPAEQKQRLKKKSSK
jgi:DNA primase